MTSTLIAAAASVFWGGTGATITAEQPTGHVATVHCRNELTQSMSITEGEISINGLTVQVRVYHQPGDQPDRFEVSPPEGYIAIPRYIYVNEHETEEIRIFEIEGMVAG